MKEAWLANMNSSRTSKDFIMSLTSKNITKKDITSLYLEIMTLVEKAGTEQPQEKIKKQAESLFEGA